MFFFLFCFVKLKSICVGCLFGLFHFKFAMEVVGKSKHFELDLFNNKESNQNRKYKKNNINRDIQHTQKSDRQTDVQIRPNINSTA